MKTRIRYKERQKIKSLLMLSIIVILIVVAILAYRTIKADLQASELTLPVAFQSEIQEADTSGEWNLILVDRMQYYAAGETVEVTVKRSGANGYEEKVIEVELGRKTDLPGYQDNANSDSTDPNQDQEQDTESDNQNDYGDQEWYDFGGRSQMPYSGGLGDLFRYFGF